MNKYIKTKTLAGFLCLLCLSACGNGQDGMDRGLNIAAENTEASSETASDQTYGNASSETASDQTYGGNSSQNRCPSIKDVDWEAY